MVWQIKLPFPRRIGRVPGEKKGDGGVGSCGRVPEGKKGGSGGGGVGLGVAVVGMLVVVILVVQFWGGSVGEIAVLG